MCTPYTAFRTEYKYSVLLTVSFYGVDTCTDLL